MTGPGRQRGQVLILLLGGLFLGGGIAAGLLTTGQPLKDIEKRAKALPLDEVREQRVLELMDAWKDVSKPAWKTRGEPADEIVRLVGERSATREQFLAEFDRLRAAMDAAHEQVLPIREQLRDTLSRDEWNALFAVD